ncbi:MAG: GNAT family N-acetyltransferase [Clostridia bacterium]|nr:GNAT family N-acetyltransferase [Clostridia bacterium]
MAKIFNEVHTMKSSIIKKCFRRIPTLQTERLILRKISVSDYNDMYEYTHINSVTDYVTWYPHPDRDYTKQYLQIVQEQYRNGEFFDWAVILRSENKMIGTCGFTSFDTQHNCGEIG